ncbi:MAG: hypothetical protein CVV64_11280 [Candidatus Wallbacteria bacterium HGW-Wallbacteria-1]|jgi:biotin transport system substrate-specific component|uniref:Biotin transporter n=1 Tax=Candidatus Wallbacteria bacterium HGW-Wallbacteria-1 TaxID=2013854 RepID=A0A2N1PP25_9BACT|nr:MAG: hypothetical protein CVV64_11280 [Candidatus Wallbacteria bacterium HGW-Wallbacteria-1]
MKHSIPLSSMMLVILSLSAQLQVPTPWGIPMTMQTCILVLVGLVLGPWHGTGVVAAYLMAGFFGFPLFAGWAGGGAVFAGPTGGFLIGFLFVPATLFLVLRFFDLEVLKTAFRLIPDRLQLFIAALLSLVPLFASGLINMVVIHGLTLERAMKIGFYPFIPGAFLKSAIAVWFYEIITGRLRCSTLKCFYVKYAGQNDIFTSCR